MTVEIKVGTIIKPDGWDFESQLIEGDHFSPLRIKTNSNGPIKSLAVRVNLSGKEYRKIPGYGGVYGQRVQIIFLGDGEPDKIAHGWAWNGTLWN